ncbi:hypothetical protein ABB37_01724 [Leptomonas pyrrhocoris]|uniref:Uncharacterized protein n=1 Tax=Leptomonas pyrrhocoris TaxID=157538 RepID=A0A0M9G9I4_LEPPY|nr:hypothetical protein ABB37_01724 [Leptomonas pyrrhocoris]KPA85416.1 hypothetical protein ABB37_01724 [Leptomonas pyrrhocoris]|eukprot:XP_015663855.1 hypothetical protein ABB37_01724 [Leptomonas pyrrhocoris]
MDRRPLLSSNRESARQPPPPQPLLPPSQVDNSLVVFEDDVGDAGNGAGASSEARTSIFDSLSFAAWSDSTVPATRGGSSTSHLVAAILRPFQRLHFWCCRGGRCCCNCLRRSDSLSASEFYENGNDVFTGGANDLVAADALRGSGVSQGSHRSKGGTPTTMPHRGGGDDDGRSASGSRQHRQYAPPRSRSYEAALGSAAAPASTSPPEQTNLAQDAADAQIADSITESSLAGSSTPPSSVAFGRVATTPGEQLVMQRGVLMRMTQDGTCIRVEDPAGFYGSQQGGRAQRHSPRTLNPEGERAGLPTTPAVAGQTLRLEQSGVSAVDNRHDPESSNAVEGALSAYAVAMAMDALETSRQPLRTLEQLSSMLSGLAPYLPLRVETELDLNSSSALPAERASSSLGTGSPTTSAAPVVPLCVHVLGPVQSCPTAAALRILEDVLLEDCDHNKMCITALHCADLDMRGITLGMEERPNLAGRQDNIVEAEEGRLRVQSNAFLDLLVSPTAADTRTFTQRTMLGDHANNSAVTDLTAAVASTHILTFLKNFVTGRGSPLATFHFTRCFVVPHDMGRFVPLPLRAVRRLRYEQCSLTPAHIDALLTLARHQDGEKHDGARGSARRSVAFGVLEELQLSGPLTSECISELLDYIEEQQLSVTEGSSTPVALHQLILPNALVRAAKEHPFVQANYQRISVVSAY